MKWNFCLTFLMAMATFQVYSQRISYGYDNAGNRISRTVVELKSTSEGDDQIVPKEEYKQELGKHVIIVYPNPVSEQLSIEIDPPDIEEPIQIILYDMKGRLVQSQGSRISPISVSFSGLSRGNYILVIRCDNEKNEWIINKE